MRGCGAIGSRDSDWDLTELEPVKGNPYVVHYKQLYSPSYMNLYRYLQKTTATLSPSIPHHDSGVASIEAAAPNASLNFI